MENVRWIENWELFLERIDKDEYPSEKEAKRVKRIGKPSTDSWIGGKDELDKLAHGLLEKEEEENCTVGNPNHHGSDGKGRFASKDDKGSWSIAYHSTKTGCNKGKLKKSANGSKQWTKASRCGRDGDYLCSEPKKKKWEESLLTTDIEDDGEFVRIRKSALDRLLKDSIGTETCSVQEGSSRKKQEDLCRRLGMKTFNEFLMILNNTRRAEDGKLMDKKN